MAERKIEYRIVEAPLFHLFRVVIIDGVVQSPPSFLGDYPSKEKAEAERDNFALQDMVLDE